MKANCLRACLQGILVLALTGCYTLRLTPQGLGPDEVYFTKVSGKLVRHISETESVAFFLWGAIPNQLRPATRLKKYLRENTRIANLRVRTEFSFVDGLLGMLTLRVYQPMTVIYEGDLIEVQ